MVHAFLDELAAGSRQLIWWTDPGQWQWELHQEVAGLLPGSFNPLHEGHLSLCRLAGQMLGGPVAAELAMINADKPPLTAEDVERRCRQFSAVPVVVTVAATFAEKSRLFPGVTFVVGADTASRVVDSRFYQGSPATMNDSLTQIERQGCSFLVAARYCEKRLLTLDQLTIPRRFRHLFREIPPEEFLMDLSSTEIRKSS